MRQVKLIGPFSRSTESEPDGKLEAAINEFLQTNAGKIGVEKIDYRLFVEGTRIYEAALIQYFTNDQQ